MLGRKQSCEPHRAKSGIQNNRNKTMLRSKVQMNSNREATSLEPISSKHMLALSDRMCYSLSLWSELYPQPTWRAVHFDRRRNQSCSPTFTHSRLHSFAAVLIADPRPAGVNAIVWCLSWEQKGRLKACWPRPWFCSSWGFASFGDFLNFMKTTKCFVATDWTHSFTFYSTWL